MCLHQALALGCRQPVERNLSVSQKAELGDQKFSFWLLSLANFTEGLTPPSERLAQFTALVVALQKEGLSFSNLTHLAASQMGAHISVLKHRLSLFKPWTLR